MPEQGTLPQSVIREDHKLEKGVEGAQEALAYLRWHWTLDEENHKRISVSAYSRSVGRAQGTIIKFAHGYEAWRNYRGTSITLGDHIERAGMGTHRAAAAEAVAAANKKPLATVARHHREDIRYVRDRAEQEVEKKAKRGIKTTVEAEAPAIAKSLAETQRGIKEHGQQRKKDLRAMHGLAFVTLADLLNKMRRDGAEAVEVAGSEFDDEARDILKTRLGQVRALLVEVGNRLDGRVSINWDKELRSIMVNAEER